MPIYRVDTPKWQRLHPTYFGNLLIAVLLLLRMPFRGLFVYAFISSTETANRYVYIPLRTGMWVAHLAAVVTSVRNSPKLIEFGSLVSGANLKFHQVKDGSVHSVEDENNIWRYSNFTRNVEQQTQQNFDLLRRHGIYNVNFYNNRTFYNVTYEPQAADRLFLQNVTTYGLVLNFLFLFFLLWGMVTGRTLRSALLNFIHGGCHLTAATLLLVACFQPSVLQPETLLERRYRAQLESLNRDILNDQSFGRDTTQKLAQFDSVLQQLRTLTNDNRFSTVFYANVARLWHVFYIFQIIPCGLEAIALFVSYRTGLDNYDYSRAYRHT